MIENGKSMSLKVIQVYSSCVILLSGRHFSLIFWTKAVPQELSLNFLIILNSFIKKRSELLQGEPYCVKSAQGELSSWCPC